MCLEFWKLKLARSPIDPDDAALVAAEKTLGVVLDHRESVLSRQLHDRVHVGRQAVGGHRNDRPGARRDAAADALRVDEESAGIDVGKHGHRLLVQHGQRGRGHGQRRHDHFVARRHAHGGQRPCKVAVPLAWLIAYRQANFSAKAASSFATKFTLAAARKATFQDLAHVGEL